MADDNNARNSQQKSRKRSKQTRNKIRNREWYCDKGSGTPLPLYVATPFFHIDYWAK